MSFKDNAPSIEINSLIADLSEEEQSVIAGGLGSDDLDISSYLDKTAELSEKADYLRLRALLMRESLQ